MPLETVSIVARPQGRPATEGWSQKLDENGQPALQFASPKRGRPPALFADLTVEQRAARMVELGHPAYPAKQVATHYFTHYSSDRSVAGERGFAGEPGRGERCGGGGYELPIGAYVSGPTGLRFRPNIVAVLVVSMPLVSALGWAVARIVKAAK